MAVNKTSLSAGAVIRALLLEDAEVSQRVNKVFPVITENATLPYIVYRRAALENIPTKSGIPTSDTIDIEVLCCTASYSEGVELAEAVRSALEFMSAEHNGQRLRSSSLTASEELYDSEAYIQQLVFTIKI